MHDKLKMSRAASGLAAAAITLLAGCTMTPSGGTPPPPPKLGATEQKPETPSNVNLEQQEQELGAVAGLSTAQMEQGRLFVNGWDGLVDEIPPAGNWTVENRANGVTPPAVDPNNPPPSGGSQPPGGGSNPPATTVSYERDVAPILEANCNSCHRQGGSRGNSPLTSYASAKQYGAQLVRKTDAGTMPPAGALPESERETLRKWQAAGFPEKAEAAGSGSGSGSGSGVEEDGNRVVFRIKKGTGNGAWNTKETEVVAKVGKPFVIINEDDVVHQWHTNGSPCPHGRPIQPGKSEECVPSRTFNAGPLYDHITDGRFYIRAE